MKFIPKKSKFGKHNNQITYNTQIKVYSIRCLYNTIKVY